MARRKAASSSQTVRRKRQTADPNGVAHRGRSPDAHDACTPASQSRVALDSLARRYQGRRCVRACAGARASGAPRLLAQPASRPEEWLLIEWPTGEQGPTKFWLSNVSTNTTLTDLVHLAKILVLHRTRLPRAQGRDRNRSLRGPRLDRLSPPRRPLHRRLCPLGRRASSAFPPAPLAFLKAAPVAPRFPPAG